MQNLLIISEQEQTLRLDRLRRAMQSQGIESALISSNANIFYLTGRVFSGYVYLASLDAEPLYFVKRPVHLLGNTISIRKPESILDELAVRGMPQPQKMGLELGELPYATAVRLMKAMKASEPLNISPCLMEARTVKTPYEISLVEESAVKQTMVYRRIPHLYNPGMSDIELQIEIERVSRLEGSLGQCRINGTEMEVHMGTVLAGDNADAPSPFDFALGGAGMNPSLPLGANGTIIRPGMSVMVDMNGNFTGYLSDMSRSFYLGHIDEKAKMAHQLSIDICHELAEMARPGTEAKALYEKAEQMAKDADMLHCFMGKTQHASFVGHGVGIELNELPVLAPRSKALLEIGNVIAIEPKFIIPGTGAVGIENTYIVTADGLKCITTAPEEIIQL